MNLVQRIQNYSRLNQLTRVQVRDLTIGQVNTALSLELKLEMLPRIKTIIKEELEDRMDKADIASLKNRLQVLVDDRFPDAKFERGFEEVNGVRYPKLLIWLKGRP